jgi:hypothetical protein
MGAPKKIKFSREAVEAFRGGMDHKTAVAKKLYEITGNPLHVWNAYRASRAVRLEVPDWVLSYFDRVAKRLFQHEEAAKRGKKLSESEIGKALGMNAPGREFRKFSETLEWADIAEDVRQQLKRGDKEKYAIEAVAEKRGKSPSAVRRAWVRAKKLFPELSD